MQKICAEVLPHFNKSARAHFYIERAMRVGDILQHCLKILSYVSEHFRF